MKKLEARINHQLNKYPILKRILKRIYQYIMYMISPKRKYEGEIKRITPKDGMEYFFGYYDKSPWDATDRYMLCLRVKNTLSAVASTEAAEIILIDTQNDNSYRMIAQTHSWNIQQGCMLSWLGPDYMNRIIFNDCRDGKYCSVILNVTSGEERIIPMPIYSVAGNGKFALSLDFSRLHRLRKGYGYANLPDLTESDKCPDQACIWYVDLETGSAKAILKYTDFLQFETRLDMIGAEHKVNHIMINPSGNRFMVLHRWFQGQRKYTRLVTANPDGTQLYNLSDNDMTSHCCWKSDTEILAYARKKHWGNSYYLLRDKEAEYQRLWPELDFDGHPSYSPDGDYVITDTYPDRKRMASIFVMHKEIVSGLVQVFAPFRYDNERRCDLHPRWNRSGNKICFDSVFEGKRELYYVDFNLPSRPVKEAEGLL